MDKDKDGENKPRHHIWKRMYKKSTPDEIKKEMPKWLLRFEETLTPQELRDVQKDVIDGEYTFYAACN